MAAGVGGLAPAGHDNAHLDTTAQRHAARLAEREPAKPRFGGLTTEYLDVIAAAPGSWYRELESTAKGGSERETWCDGLARALDERGRDRLTPEAVALVLAAWTRLRGGERDQRPRRELWWSKHWPWVLAQLPAPKLAVVDDCDDPYRIEAAP